MERDEVGTLSKLVLIVGVLLLDAALVYGVFQIAIWIRGHM